MQLGLIRELIGLLPVGKQWGKQGSANQQVTFPISFLTGAYLIAGIGNGGNWAWVNTVDVNQLDLRCYSPAFWVAGGF